MEIAVAITDRMKCGVKPSAVRSENYLHNTKASNGASFDVAMGQDISFDVPAQNESGCVTDYRYYSSCWYNCQEWKWVCEV